jgi:hypothetical protein
LSEEPKPAKIAERPVNIEPSWSSYYFIRGSGLIV